MSQEKLSLSDISEVFDSHKLRISKIFNSIPRQTIQDSQNLVIDIILAFVVKFSRPLALKISDKIYAFLGKKDDE